jgi:hypothetical protein
MLKMFWAVAKTLPKNLIVDPRVKSRTAPASEAPALSLLYARRVTRWKYLGGWTVILKVCSHVYRVTGVRLYLTSRRGKLKKKGRRVMS